MRFLHKVQAAGDMQFTAKLKEVTVFGQTGDVKNVMVKWHLDIEAREWGIKAFTPVVPDQKIVGTLEDIDDNGEDTSEKWEYDIKNVEVELNYGGDDRKDLCMGLVEMTIDAKHNKITATFSI